MIVAGVISLVIAGILLWWVKQDMENLAMPMFLIAGLIFAGVGVALIANNDSPERPAPIIITCEEPGIHDVRTGYSESIMVVCP